MRTNEPTISAVLTTTLGTRDVSLERYTETLFGQEYAKLDYWQTSVAGPVAARRRPAAERAGFGRPHRRRSEQAGLLHGSADWQRSERRRSQRERARRHHARHE